MKHTRAWEQMGYKSYAAYLKSTRWREIRQRVFETKTRHCIRCRGYANQVHHEWYDLLTMQGGDLTALHPICEYCHKLASVDNTGRKRSLYNTNRFLGLFIIEPELKEYLASTPAELLARAQDVYFFDDDYGDAPEREWWPDFSFSCSFLSHLSHVSSY